MPRYGTKFMGRLSNSDGGSGGGDSDGGGSSTDGASNLKSTKINFASERCQNVHFHAR